MLLSMKIGKRRARLKTYAAEMLALPGSWRSKATSPSCTIGLTQFGDCPRAVCVAEGGVKGTTWGVRAPANGAIGAPPGGVKIRLGNVSTGQVVGLQLKVCWMTPFSTRVA